MAKLLVFISLLLYRSQCNPAITENKPRTVTFGERVYTIQKSLGDRVGIVTNSDGDKLLVKEVHFDNCDQNGFLTSMSHLAKAKERYAVKMHQYYFANCNGYMIFKFMPAGDMRQLLRYTGGKLGNEKAVRFMAINMVAAMIHMHSIVGANGYLKPDEDFVLDISGEPMVSDFGYSRIYKKYSADYVPYYMAPEVLQGNIPTKAADWYSLGAFLWELVTGSPPYSKEQLNKFKTQGWKFTQAFGNQSQISDVHLKSLLVGFLDISATKRLGAGNNNIKDGSMQVQGHPYFADVSWVDVTNKEHMSPPYAPKIEKGNFLKYDDTIAKKELKIPILDHEHDTHMQNAPEIEWPGDKIILD
ncbi:protein kinase domain-containing protein [Ditylenchus destructor]|uniref:Protein kinase domain-containing protein n=1 Tax=Ditylenchus destructor TaxID=166010 RepID=A0AAD4N3X2_9BILA|nr:protein kinase domain-containing protein [Ditylenchus destructor]